MLLAGVHITELSDAWPVSASDCQASPCRINILVLISTTKELLVMMIRKNAIFNTLGRHLLAMKIDNYDVSAE